MLLINNSCICFDPALSFIANHLLNNLTKLTNQWVLALKLLYINNERVMYVGTTDIIFFFIIVSLVFVVVFISVIILAKHDIFWTQLNKFCLQIYVSLDRICLQGKSISSSNFQCVRIEASPKDIQGFVSSDSSMWLLHSLQRMFELR